MTRVSRVDAPRLRKVLEHITADPKSWDQTQWAVRTPCGTTHCVAGHAVRMFDDDAHFRWYRITLRNEYADNVSRDDGVVQSVAGRAAELLGLTATQADLLFAGGNTLVELWYAAEILTEGEIRVPVEVLGVVGENFLLHVERVQRLARRTG